MILKVTDEIKNVFRELCKLEDAPSGIGAGQSRGLHAWLEKDAVISVYNSVGYMNYNKYAKNPFYKSFGVIEQTGFRLLTQQQWQFYLDWRKNAISFTPNHWPWFRWIYPEEWDVSFKYKYSFRNRKHNKF